MHKSFNTGTEIDESLEYRTNVARTFYSFVLYNFTDALAAQFV